MELMSADEHEAELEKEVAGEYNTLRTYLLLLRMKQSSARETQRALDFSSPTLAQHHLDKLCRYQLATKDYDGTYHVKSKSFGVLKLYYRSGRWIVPRTIFFVVIFSLLSVGFTLSIRQGPYFLIASVLCFAGLIFALYETIRFYKILPHTG